MEKYSENLSSWDKTILTRGKRYFQEGKVGKIQQNGNRFWAYVNGSKPYLVTLEFDQDKRLIAASCNCPFPHHCKHEAALCYALDALPKNVEDSVMTSLDGLKQRLHKAVEESDIAAFSSLAFSYAGMLPLCSPEIVSLCVKDYFLAFFQEGSFSKEPSVFEELFSRFLAHMKASEEEKYDWMTFWDRSLRQEIPAHDRMIAALLGSSQFTVVAQRFLCENNNALNEASLSSLRHRDIPPTMLPAFVLLLAKQRPHEIPSNAIDNAKKEYQLHEQPEKVLALLRLSLTNGYYEQIRDEDFRYLRSVGLVLDARELAENLFKQTDRLGDYLRLRSFYGEEDFAPVAIRISPFLSGKSYVSTVMLFDGERYYPRLSSRLKTKTYRWDEIYDARSFFHDHKTKEQLQIAAENFISNELAKKRRDLSYFDALLFLADCHDSQVSYYLSLPLLQEDAANGPEKAIWLWLLEHENRFAETGRFPYLEDHHVSD
ncbi:MAG: hypothetical protein PUC66_01545 [Erysipelotrichaceae bacterium]|nr:hypothetical protein [Erysipelotrichaceae bacterium]